jgi:hypothetical protein
VQWKTRASTWNIQDFNTPPFHNFTDSELIRPVGLVIRGFVILGFAWAICDERPYATQAGERRAASQTLTFTTERLPAPSHWFYRLVLFHVPRGTCRHFLETPRPAPAPRDLILLAEQPRPKKLGIVPRGTCPYPASARRGGFQSAVRTSDYLAGEQGDSNRTPEPVPPNRQLPVRS